MSESMPRYILKERSEQKLSMRCISTNLARPSRARQSRNSFAVTHAAAP